MKRRQFIKTLSHSSIGLPLMVNGLAVSPLAQSRLFSSLSSDTDRVLVLIRLNGGNDGLNTFVPIDQYEALMGHRSNVILPENSLLDLTNDIKLHPVLGALKSVYDDGQMSVIHSVGYPNQNRSHFRSTDIWTSGSSAEEVILSGWLGRFLNEEHQAFPDNFPNEDYTDPFAITIGNTVSQTCQGYVSNFSMAIEDPFNLSPLTSGQTGATPDNFYGTQLEFLRVSIQQTNAYSETIGEAANMGTTTVDYPDSDLAEKLKTVAQLIAGGLKSKIYIVNQGGYDTHGSQVESSSETTEGEHAELLTELSEAIHAFQSDINAMNLQDRVIGMTFSEFGRQIKSNGSLGTDHGTAAPLIVFGDCVNPGFIGSRPEIPEEIDDEEGVPMQFDFRSVYGSILEDWFGASPTHIQEIIYSDYQYIPILSCALTGNRDQVIKSTFAENFPNPFREMTTIRFECQSENVKLSIFDGYGKEIRVLSNQFFNAGEHQIQFEAHRLPAGNYYFHLLKKSGIVTKNMVKM